MMRLLKILLFFIGSIESRLRFKVEKIDDGAISMFVKEDKKMAKDLGEDAYMSTPFGLVVADGIGGSPFLSYYMANYLTFFAAEYFTDYQNRENDFIQTIETKMKSAIKTYKTRTVEIFNAESFGKTPSTIENGDKYKFHMVASTTVAAFIDNNNLEAPKLRIFNRGDSSLVLFRRQLNEKTEKYFYAPVFAPKSEVKAFNFPIQSTAFGDQAAITADNFQEVATTVGDIVLMGSDGFFDNVHLSLTTFALNWIIHQLHDKTKQNIHWEDEIKNLADNYHSFISKLQKKACKKFSESEEKKPFQKSETKKRAINEKEDDSCCLSFWTSLFGDKRQPIPKPIQQKTSNQHDSKQ